MKSLDRKKILDELIAVAKEKGYSEYAYSFGVISTYPAGAHLTVKDRIIAAENTISAQSVLNGLTDVTITSVSAGNVLQYNGSVWVNAE